MTISPNEFTTTLYSWICPVCGVAIDVKVREEDLFSLTVEEIRTVLNTVKGPKTGKHKCVHIPVQYSERIW